VDGVCSCAPLALGSTRGSGRCRLSDRKGDLPRGRRRAEERAVGLPVRGPVLTSPFLEAQGTENGDPSLARAREEVEELIQQAQQIDPTLHVSLHARDLDDGPWIGIDERERYPPASLSKVAILVYTLRREESDPGFLEQEVVFPGPDMMFGDDSMMGAPDSLRLRTGERYSYRDLLRRMIAYSDNFATQMLMDEDTGTGLERMLYSLSAEQSFQDGTLSVDARTVAGLLRVLYNSSFLSRQHSEFALELLTESYFADGLRRLLPTDVVVASKFGFHGSEAAGRLHHELHECGIIYRPRSPYVICVMTRTDRSSPESLDELVGEISRIVWAQQTD